MNIILVGEMGAGKDVLASLLTRHVRKAFGDKIREIVELLRTGCVRYALDRLEKMLKGRTPWNLYGMLWRFSAIPKTDQKDRRILQELGTYCRSQYDLIWVDAVLDTLLLKEQYIITDCRRQGELNACKALGFRSIAVVADLEVRKERLMKRDGTFNPEWLQHPAEQEIQRLIPQCDITVTNNGSIEELREQLKSKGIDCYYEIHEDP